VKEHTNSSVGIVSHNANLGQHIVGAIEHICIMVGFYGVNNGQNYLNPYSIRTKL